MNIRQCRGTLRSRKSSLPCIVPVSQALFLATGVLVPATDRRGLGAAKESPRFAPDIPHTLAADPGPGCPCTGALAGLERFHDLTNPVRAHGQEGRCAPLAPGPGLRPRHAPAGPPRRRRRPHRPGGAACARLRLPELSHPAPGPVLRGDRPQGRRLRSHGRQRAAAAAGARHPELGAPLRRALAGRPVQAGAGDQRLRGAVGEPVAGLQGASGAACGAPAG